MESFLRKRGLPEDIIVKFEAEKVHNSCAFVFKAAPIWYILKSLCRPF
jgi:hypothetical protein